MLNNVKDTVKQVAKYIAWQSLFTSADQVVRSVVAHRVKKAFGVSDSGPDGVQSK
jgi:hypothetical protein